MFKFFREGPYTAKERNSLVENVLAHSAADRRDLVGKCPREQSLEMAHQH